MLHPPAGNRAQQPDYVEYALNQLRAEHRAGSSFEKLSDQYAQFIGVMPMSVCTIKAGSLLVRARKKRDPIPFNRFSKITMRDATLVKSYNRASVPGKSIFYGCVGNELGQDVAIREATQWHITDLGTLTSRNLLKDYQPWSGFACVSIWRVKEPLTLASLFLNQTAMEINPTARHFGGSTLNDNINNWDELTEKSKKLILQFFSDEFSRGDIRQERDYFLSAYYANSVMGVDVPPGKIDGVVYPSVALQFRGENVALSEIAYRKLEFDTAWHCYIANVEGIGEQMANGHPVGVGELYEVVEREGDLLRWKDLTTNELLPLDDSE